MTTPRPRPWRDHYDPWVPRELTYPDRPLHAILDRAAAQWPDEPAATCLGTTRTFVQLRDEAVRFTARLAALGVAPGDRVGVMLPNCLAYIVATFGILGRGAVVVNVNPALTARELSAIVADAGIRVLVTRDAAAEVARHVQQTSDLAHVEIASDMSAKGAGDEGAGMNAAGVGMNAAGVGNDALALLQYTGGTTGAPKGVMLTHANLFANVVQMSAYTTPPDAPRGRYLLVIPYFHIYGFTVGMLKGLWLGAHQILLPKYDADAMLDAIRTYRPTYVPAVPTIFVSLLGHPRAGESGLDQVDLFNTGGAPCPLDVLAAWERTTGRPLNQGYGLSESAPVTHSTPQQGRRRPGTVGLPIPDTDMKIVDLETGDRELTTGEVGELCVAGPQVMRGYWRRPDETARVLRPDADGRLWLHTGDIARVDGDGFTTIVQRKTDLILVDAFNVYPSEIEEVLAAHPAVRAAAAIGVPDRYHGEVVRASVVLRDGATVSTSNFLAHCRAHLAPYKVPRAIDVRAELPASPVGKRLYRVLRDQASGVASAVEDDEGPS